MQELLQTVNSRTGHTLDPPGEEWRRPLLDRGRGNAGDMRGAGVVYKASGGRGSVQVWKCVKGVLVQSSDVQQKPFSLPRSGVLTYSWPRGVRPDSCVTSASSCQ